MLRNLNATWLLIVGLGLLLFGATGTAEAVIEDHWCKPAGDECSVNNHGGPVDQAGSCTYQCWYCPPQPDTDCVDDPLDLHNCDTIPAVDCPNMPAPMKSPCTSGTCTVPWVPITTDCGQWVGCVDV